MKHEVSCTVLLLLTKYLSVRYSGLRKAIRRMFYHNRKETRFKAIELSLSSIISFKNMLKTSQEQNRNIIPRSAEASSRSLRRRKKLFWKEKTSRGEMSTGGRNFSDKFLLFHYFTSEKQSTYVGTAGTVTINFTRKHHNSCFLSNSRTLNEKLILRSQQRLLGIDFNK